jgi:large subunit ribosomal protein L6
MSRVGKLPITLPKGVSINREADRVAVKGPKGQLHLNLQPEFSVAVEDGVLTVTRPSDEKRHKALHGLYRALLNNLIKGVSEGFELQLELVGVGYRAEAKGQLLDLALGFSHQVLFLCPPEISVATINEKGKNPTIILKGIDRQLIGQVAAKIRAIRPPEPYKGKGVRFVGEVVRRKAGKTSGKGGKK